MMKHIFLAATAALAILSATAASRADDISDIRAQSAALKKQNAALEARIRKLEKQQKVEAKKIEQAKFVAQQPAAAAQPAAESFLGMVTKGPLEAIADDSPLCWKGLCVFGTVDAGVGWVSHGLPENGQNYEGESLINKFTNHPYFGVAQNGLSQSTIGLKGEAELVPGWAGVFMASTGFNPQSGQLANMPGTLVANQGLSRNSYSFLGDGGRGGQAFNDQLYVGVNSHDFGQLTFGRHRPFSQELMLSYDPAGGAYDFSPIGFNGQLVQGLGATEDARWDDSLKYKLIYGPAHGGLMYKFADGAAGASPATNSTLCPKAPTPFVPVAAPCANYSNTTTIPAQQFYTPHNDALQFNLGGSYGGLDVDGVIGYYHQAVAILGGNSPLNAVQLAGADTFVFNNGTILNTTGNGSNANTLQAYVADNTAGALGAKYTWDRWKVFAGWAHIVSHNPANNLGIGATNDQGGYVLSTVNNGFFAHARLLDTVWTGVRYAWNPKTDIVFGYYHVNQNAFGNAAQLSTCSAPTQNAKAAQCSGTLDAGSIFVDYHFSKRFDVYAGLEVSNVEGGLAGGTLPTGSKGGPNAITGSALGFNYYTNWAPSAGLRYSF